MFQNTADQCAGRYGNGIFQHCLRAAAAGVCLVGHRAVGGGGADGLPCGGAGTLGRGAAYPGYGTPCLRRPGAVPQPVYVPAGRAVRRPGCGAALCPVFAARHCAGSAVRLSDGSGTWLLGGIAEHDAYGGLPGAGGCGKAGAGTGAVPVGAGASGNRLPPCAGGRAAFCAGGCRGSAGCDAVHRHGLAVLSAAWTALREPPATGQCTGCTHGADLPAAALCDDSGGAGVSGDESHLAAGSGDHDALSGQGADAAQRGTAPAVRDSCICTGFSGVCLRFVYRHGDHGVQPGAVCDQYAGEERTALCGGALGKTGSGRGCGAYSFGNRCSGGNGAPGGRRLVGAGRAGDAHSLRRQTRRGCHRRRGIPHAAPRHGLPLSHLSALQHFAGRRESRRSGGVYAGRGRRETPGQPGADSTSGVLHHRRRYRHIIVLSGTAGADPVAAAALSGKAAASNANPAAHCACSRVLYGGGVVLPGTDGCAGNAALCGGGSGRRLSGISGGTVSAGAAPAETDRQYTIK